MPTQDSKRNHGHVYVLVSPNSKFVKIGGTGYPPLKRIKEINAVEPYKQHGVWALHDFRQVADWRLVESKLHYILRSKLDTSIQGQRELFAVSPLEASECLNQIDESQVLRKPKVDRLFQDKEFSIFLAQFFRTTTLMNWLNIQGAWTLSLFPSTSGGRYYTLNIDNHEVAYAPIPRSGEPQHHMFFMDSLIENFRNVEVWLKEHRGGFYDDPYTSSIGHGTAVEFEGDFTTATEFLALKGVRRAIIAYWTEALVEMQERGALSVNNKHHNWNAVAELKRRMDIGEL